MATEAEAPIRVAPASSMARAAAASRTPPLAFTPTTGPTARRMSATSSTVAPPLLKPVEVFTKSAPAALQSSLARTISSLVSRQVSRMTFRRAPSP